MKKGSKRGRACDQSLRWQASFEFDSSERSMQQTSRAGKRLGHCPRSRWIRHAQTLIPPWPSRCPNASTELRGAKHCTAPIATASKVCWEIDVVNKFQYSMAWPLFPREPWVCPKLGWLGFSRASIRAGQGAAKLTRPAFQAPQLVAIDSLSGLLGSDEPLVLSFELSTRGRERAKNLATIHTYPCLSASQRCATTLI